MQLDPDYTETFTWVATGTVTDTANWSVTGSAAAGGTAGGPSGSVSIGGANEAANSISGTITLVVPIKEGQHDGDYSNLKPQKPASGWIQGWKVRTLNCSLAEHASIESCPGWIDNGGGWLLNDCWFGCDQFLHVSQVKQDTLTGTISAKFCDLQTWSSRCPTGP